MPRSREDDLRSMIDALRSENQALRTALIECAHHDDHVFELKREIRELQWRLDEAEDQLLLLEEGEG